MFECMGWLVETTILSWKPAYVVHLRAIAFEGASCADRGWSRIKPCARSGGTLSSVHSGSC